jgi:hypothetical protein
MGLVVGVILMIAARIVGMFKSIPLSSLTRLMPYMWFGFVVNATSGVFLFIADATRFYYAPTFQLKILFIATGVALVAILDFVFLRPASRTGGASPARTLPLKVGEIVLYVLLLVWNLINLLWLFAAHYEKLAYLDLPFAILIAVIAAAVVVLWLLDLRKPAQSAAGATFFPKLLTGLFIIMVVVDLAIMLGTLGLHAGAIITSIETYTVRLKVILTVLFLTSLAMLASILALLVSLAGWVFRKRAFTLDLNTAVMPAPAKLLAVASIIYWWVAVIMSGRLIAYLTR